MAVLPIKTTVTNVGHLPAFNVYTVIEGFADYEGGESAYTAQTRICDKIAAGSSGAVLFPGDPVAAETNGGPAWTFDKIPAAAVRHNALGLQVVNLNIYGCSIYRYGNSTQTHRTGFILQLGHLVNEGRNIDFGFPIGATIEKGKHLIASPFPISRN